MKFQLCLKNKPSGGLGRISYRDRGIMSREANSMILYESLDSVRCPCYERINLFGVGRSKSDK